MIYFCPSTLSRKKNTSIIILSNYILLRNCFFRLYPSQELSFQTKSFSGIVFSDYTLFRNCLFRLYHSHELSVQTISFSGIVFSDYIIRMNRLTKYLYLPRGLLQLLRKIRICRTAGSGRVGSCRPFSNSTTSLEQEDMSLKTSCP